MYTLKPINGLIFKPQDPSLAHGDPDVIARHTEGRTKVTDCHAFGWNINCTTYLEDQFGRPSRKTSDNNYSPCRLSRFVKPATSLRIKERPPTRRRRQVLQPRSSREVNHSFIPFFSSYNFPLFLTINLTIQHQL
ncbi:unnamed protein product [Colias eurytheme]|nr:unnamed protein product [Colias eurytheme]